MSAAAHAPDEQLEAAVAELEAALGRRASQAEIGRLQRQPGGTYQITIYEPNVARADLGDDDLTPWRLPLGAGMSRRARSVSIAEGAALMLDPSSGVRELARRDGLWSAEATRRADEEVAYRARLNREEAERREQEAQTRRARERFDGDGWDRLKPLGKVVYSLALLADDGLSGPALGEALRRLARDIEAGRPIPFPGRRWA